MIKKISLTFFSMFLAFSGFSQEIEFTEYNLDNGLHVILHKDNSAPVVTVGVMYHIGAKDEEKGKSGFAHFFEHLLFEGTKYIERGEWFNIVAAHGGSNNANTTQDRTYYYETFPSNNLKLALWMESERMLHPVINQIGVDTQKEVVKEEKRTRVDNAPYGKIIYGTAIPPYLFKKHPYKGSVIGTMEELSAAKLSDFKSFHKYYNPSNAALVVSGDIDIDRTKELIKGYFGPISQGPEIVHPTIEEEPIAEMMVDTVYDSNIKLPLALYAYRTPGLQSRDAYVLDMISTVLTNGKSSRLYKKMVDEEKQALQVLALNRTKEDYGVYIIGAIPMGDTALDTLLQSVDEEINKIQTELISEREYQKLQNIMLNRYVSSNSSMQGIASSLVTYYTLYDDTSLINEEIDIYQSITREEIREVANEYLQDDQRLKLYYLPASEKPESDTE